MTIKKSFQMLRNIILSSELIIRGDTTELNRPFRNIQRIFQNKTKQKIYHNRK